MPTAIQQFNDFMQSTGPSYLTGPDKIINEAVLHRYLWGDLIRGQAQRIQGGTQIQDVIMFDDARTFQMYSPNATFTYTNPQVQKTLRAPWRFGVDHMAWTDHEIELNVGEGLTREQTKTVYKRLKRSKEQRLATSLLNGLEATLVAPPDLAAMEELEGDTVYSIPVFVHDYLAASGSVAGPTSTAGRPYGWAGAILGQDPATEQRWQNQVGFYDPAITGNAAATDHAFTGGTIGNATVPIRGLLTALDDMWLRLSFRPPAMMSEYFEVDSIRRQMILCSREGMNLYKRLLREENESLVTPQDSAYNTPTYSGIPLRYFSSLDNAPIYPAATAAVDPNKAGVSGATITGRASESAANAVAKGPRFYFVNAEYLSPYIHSRRYMVKHDVTKHPQQPFNNVQLVDCWWNLCCNSRQRHGIVAPLPTT